VNLVSYPGLRHVYPFSACGATAPLGSGPPHCWSFYLNQKPVIFCTIDITTYVRLLWPILLLFYRNFGISSLNMAWYNAETCISYVKDSTSKYRILQLLVLCKFLTNFICHYLHDTDEGEVSLQAERLALYNSCVQHKLVLLFAD
jgi:hypothetical protein